MADQAEEAHRDRSCQLRPGAVQDAYRLVDLRSLFAAQVLEQPLATVDDGADGGDLLGRGDCGVAGPLLEAGRGGPQPLPVGQQAGR